MIVSVKETERKGKPVIETLTDRPKIGRPPKDYDWATEYANKAVNGDILVNKKNYAVALRHLNNIHYGVDGYTFIPEEANKVIQFIEMLPDPKTGKPLKLTLFQKFIVSSLYGWVDENGFRRFTKAYISMARKNGKSLLINGIALYELLLGKYPVHGREIYVASLTLRQAQTIYNMSYRQLSLLSAGSKSLRSSVELRKTDITHLPTNSTFMALSNNPDAVDGKNVSMGILDEYASVGDTEMYNRLRTSMSLQKNALMILISTASNNLNSPMYNEYGYITRLLDGEVENENYFIFCAEMDSEDEIEDETKWIKAMPLLESEHRPTILRNVKQDMLEQRELGDEKGILIKSFNLWQATNQQSYIPINRWSECLTEDEVDITGTDTYVGIDLARINDISAISFAHAMGDGKLYVDTHGFVSMLEDIDLKSKRDKIDYIKLAEEGYVSLSNSESGIIDYDQMVDWLMEYEAKHNLNIISLVYDNWDAEAFIQAATRAGAKWKGIMLPQSYKGMSPSTKQFRYSVYNKKIMHKNNPLLNIGLHNAAVRHYDGNIKIDKNKRREKIDSVVALINAFSEAKDHEYAPESISKKIKSGRFSF